MRIIFVPAWLECQIKFAGRSVKSLSSKELLDTLSNKDVAFYMYLQTALHSHLPDAVKRDFKYIEDINQLCSYDERTAMGHDGYIYSSYYSELCAKYTYDPSLSDAVNLCLQLGVGEEAPTYSNDKCYLGFDVIEHTAEPCPTALHIVEETFFVVPKVVGLEELIQSYDQIFSLINKLKGSETVASLNSFIYYESIIGDAAKRLSL